MSGPPPSFRSGDSLSDIRSPRIVVPDPSDQPQHQHTEVYDADDEPRAPYPDPRDPRVGGYPNDFLLAPTTPMANSSLFSPDPTSSPIVPAAIRRSEVPLYGQRSPGQPPNDVPQWTPAFNRAAAEAEEDFPIRRRRVDDPRNESIDDSSRYSMSSYAHPYDIAPPSNAHVHRPSSERPAPGRSALRRSVSFAPPEVREYYKHNDPEADPERGLMPQAGPDDHRRSLLSNMIQLYGVDQQDRDRPSMSVVSRDSSRETEYEPYGRPSLTHRDSQLSDGSYIDHEGMDPDDPRLTNVKPTNYPHGEKKEDIEKEAMRQMDYRQRKKIRQRQRIEFNITSILNRHRFLLKLARALMTFGAPSHRIESQLIACARILEVEAEFIHLPSVIICSFGDQETKTSDTHFVKCGGRLALGNLHKVHLIYRNVVHDELSAKDATGQLQALLDAKPLYGSFMRCVLAFSLSALICPLAFGGSFLDMWIAGAGAFTLCALQVAVATSAIYANVFEITIAIAMSFAARGLSSIKSEIFCYTAISSSAIIGILPGYLILSSSLELASKNIVCGSVKMVYALIYTLFLGFGLQIGSDLYLLFDPAARRRLSEIAAQLAPAVTMAGSFLSDNTTTTGGFDSTSSLPLSGSWTFSPASPSKRANTVEGCYRAPDGAWFVRTFPFWTQFVIVPLFSFLSSLANLQPIWSKQLPVMVIISCASYASNKVANSYIFNHSDVVSAIGAFTVGLLGNMYSRKMGGTAFTSMVTGVLFLVPSGLSQAGGITANASGLDIGGSMISVTIGITVGLFMSQALVYMFGSQKNAAVFSF